MKLFKQRSAKLANGTIVREGDLVEFTNVDGEKCRDRIKRDVNNRKRLFFWNNSAEISDYENAVKIKRKDKRT